MCSVSQFFSPPTLPPPPFSPHRSFVARSVGRVIAQERKERKKEPSSSSFPPFSDSVSSFKKRGGEEEEGEAGESFSAKFDWRLKAGREGEREREKEEEAGELGKLCAGKGRDGDRKVLKILDPDWLPLLRMGREAFFLSVFFWNRSGKI